MIRLKGEAQAMMTTDQIILAKTYLWTIMVTEST